MILTLLAVLLFLHRGFFAKAMAERPDNPGDTPYRHSFVTSYHCACTVLRATAAQFVQQPQLLSRVWQIWTFAFSSAVRASSRGGLCIVG